MSFQCPAQPVFVDSDTVTVNVFFVDFLPFRVRVLQLTVGGRADDVNLNPRR